MPLSTPERPWSHIAVDFVTDLPLSQRYMVIMIVVFKGCRLIPFDYFPSALQVAEALFQNVFHCYGIPEEILSDMAFNSCCMSGERSLNGWGSRSV